MNRSKDIVLITGGSGSLAKYVGQFLEKEYQIRYLTSSKKLAKRNSYFYWNITKEYIDKNALKDCNHIIHLAGYPILKKWTPKNKKLIYDSRVKGADLILKGFQNEVTKPKTFISASATGIYTESTKEEITESSLKATNWIGKLCCDWERSANQFEKLGARVVQMRISLIFSNSSGFLKYTLLSMKYGIGLIIGKPKRNINWIHIHDIARFLKISIEDEKYTGPYNINSEQSISQGKFIKLIKDKLYPYSIIINLPNYIAKFFMGNRFQVINTDLTINTDKLKESGFTYKYAYIEDIIKENKTLY